MVEFQVYFEDGANKFFYWIDVGPERRGFKNNAKLFSLSTWKQGCYSMGRLWIEQIWENSPELGLACVMVAIPTRYPSEDVESAVQT